MNQVLHQPALQRLGANSLRYHPLLQVWCIYFHCPHEIHDFPM